ncbi:MAG: signal peptidase II [bacterium]|nr:signal peptidase II [bacterium]
MTSPKVRNAYIASALTTLLAVGLDQLTKYLVVLKIPFHGEIPVIPHFFNLVFIRNKGAAFGFLSGSQHGFAPTLFLVLTILATSFVVYLLYRNIRESWSITLSISLILGGAVGNLIDRVRSGSVVDFLDLYVKTTHWPSFNLADSFITVGGILLLAKLLFTPRIFLGSSAPK